MAERDLTEEEVADLKEAFAMFDINGDGRFKQAMGGGFRMCAVGGTRVLATADFAVLWLTLSA